MRPILSRLVVAALTLALGQGLAACSWQAHSSPEQIRNGWLSWSGPVVDSEQVARSGGALSWPDGPETTEPPPGGGNGFSSPVVEAAVEVRGRPYRLGANGPDRFDCSGLVQYAYGQAGMQVPRTTSQQFRRARHVDQNRMRPGDIIFFAVDGIRVSHVGLYAGDDRFIHSPSPGKSVSWASLDNDYWASRFAGAGRFGDGTVASR